MKKHIITLAIMLGFSCAAYAQCPADTTTHEVLFETSKGNIRVMLYNETPKHRDNFLKLVRDGFYEGILFHRVIEKFMIQAGDPDSKNADDRSVVLGEGDGAPRVPAEIVWPVRYHKRGALAAAREGDAENPERMSSGSQFYIVYGKRFTPEQLDKVQERIDAMTNGSVKLTPELREVYEKNGGTPHLDGSYTVFGEVVEGLETVRDIQWVETDENDRPIEDVKILRATIVK